MVDFRKFLSSIVTEAAHQKKPEDWDLDTPCRVHPQFFTPPIKIGGERKEEREVREHKAKTLCSGCPSKLPCLERAFSAEIEQGHKPCGIYAGLNAPQRIKLINAMGAMKIKEIPEDLRKFFVRKEEI